MSLLSRPKEGLKESLHRTGRADLRHPALRLVSPWGQRLGSHLGDGTDCPSVPSGLTASVESGIGGFSVESGIGGFFGGSTTTVCRCSLRAASFCCGCRLLGSFVFSGGTTGVASGNS